MLQNNSQSGSIVFGDIKLTGEEMKMDISITMTFLAET